MIERNQLRKDFLEILRKEQIGFVEVAKEIGIAHQTFLHFIHAKRVIALKTAWKIESWVQKRKKL